MLANMPFTKYAWWIFFALIVAYFAIGHAFAQSVPNIQCNSGNLQLDYQCMRDNWRPKKQISYDTGRAYCDSSEGVLHGKGEIRLNVDDTPYVFKIDCK
jgi:hypothetical protein